MKNIVGDALHFPSLADATFALMDIDPKRLEESEVVAKKIISSLGSPAKVETHDGPPPRARRRRFRRHRLPDRRLPPLDRHRLRDPEAVRPPPDHRRHPRRGRHHARPPHRPPPLGRGAGHGRALPRRAPPPVREPHGDQHMVARGTLPAGETGGPLPLRPEHGGGTGPRPRPPQGGNRLPRRRREPRGLLPAARAQGPRPLPGAPAGLPRRRASRSRPST